MTNIEKIRQEIERRKKICEGIFERESDTYYQGKAVAYGELLPFIDSLPEENPSYVTESPGDPGNPGEPGISDLEEAAEEYADKHGFRVPYDGSNNYYDDVDVKASREGFLAGAEWQKEQMTKDAVEGVICYGSKGAYVESDWLGTTDVEVYGDSGDKVKIIIVKE